MYCIPDGHDRAGIKAPKHKDHDSTFDNVHCDDYPHDAHMKLDLAAWRDSLCKTVCVILVVGVTFNY